MLEFGQEVFAVELVVIKKMLQGIIRLLELVDAEEIFPLFFCELDLYIVVDAKVKPQPVVQLARSVLRGERLSIAERCRHAQCMSVEARPQEQFDERRHQTQSG